ncbi:hypothetical protein NM688_g5982 [Phlebia brevispora]|uniref:Uncharacterized protein n=1 Tax=Phlebia brevispora TaxID=194682 RepID=A0ACC1SLS2_9APHY|nr:hypothetical protein NM688_g5982 [Phlebia brevispora]
MGPSITRVLVANEEEVDSDWKLFYVDIFVDRDMIMRYLGSGIGHLILRGIVDIAQAFKIIVGLGKTGPGNGNTNEGDDGEDEEDEYWLSAEADEDEEDEEEVEVDEGDDPEDRDGDEEEDYVEEVY